MAKQKNSLNFDFKRGETLEVFDRFVRAYNKDLGERIYSLDGKLLGRHSIKEIKIAETKMNAFLYIPLSGCILIKEGKNWHLFSYYGEKLFDKPINKIDVKQRENGYIILHYYEKDVGDQSAVISVTGRFLIPFGKYKFYPYEKYIIVECDNGKFKFYDIKFESFLDGEYEEIKPFFENAILKTSKEWLFYNTSKKKIEFEFDVFVSLHTRVPGFDFYEFYYKGSCGLYAAVYAKKYGIISYCNLILPIEYQKIECKDDQIIALKNGVFEYHSYHSINKLFSSKQTEQEDKDLTKESVSKEESIVKLFGRFEITSGHKAFLGNKFIAISTDKKLYKYFSLNGTYIGESDQLSDEEGYTYGLSYITTKGWIALSEYTTTGFGIVDGIWNIYSYDGNKIFPIKFRKLDKNSQCYYIASRYRYYEEKCKDNFIVVFTITGRLLFTLKGAYKDLTVFDTNFFIAEDLDKKFWLFDQNGNLIFEEGLNKSEFNSIKNTFWVECDEGYKVYDLITRKVYKVRINKIEKIYNQSTDYFYKIYSQGKCGIFATTDERGDDFRIVGLKEIIPIIYEKINYDGNYFRAIKEKCEAVYDYSGKMITTTEK